MTARTITLEMTQDEANVCLETLVTKRTYLRKFVGLHAQIGKEVNPQVLDDLAALEYLVSTLKTKIGHW